MPLLGCKCSAMYKLKMDGTYKSKMDSTFKMLQSGFAQFVNWMKMDMRQVRTSNYDTPTLPRSQATATPKPPCSYARQFL